MFDLLKYRLVHRGNVRSEKQKEELNDLMVRELYISASFGNPGNIFEIAKNHRLFQASYLMGVGESVSALNSFRELVRLLTRTLSSGPTLRYTISRCSKEFSTCCGRHATTMKWITSGGNWRLSLRDIPGSSRRMWPVWRSNTRCSPYFDRGDYAACRDLMGAHKELYDNIDRLSSLRKSELLLYTAFGTCRTGRILPGQKTDQFDPFRSKHRIPSHHEDDPSGPSYGLLRAGEFRPAAV